MEAEKVYAMDFSKIYQALLNKTMRKGRRREELDEIITWLTGYEEGDLEKFLEEEEISYGDFFRQAPAMHPARFQITGSICGVKLAEIQDPLLRDIRFLDKLVDELAKGKVMEKILRKDRDPVGSYILGQDEKKRPYLEKVREIFLQALPEAREKLAWQMPTYWQGKNIIHFAAAKAHVGIYPGPAAIKHFSKELESYKTSKGAWQIPYGEPLPEDLLKKMAVWCLESIHLDTT